jgi:hypothetical protein
MEIGVFLDMMLAFTVFSYFHPKVLVRIFNERNDQINLIG